MRLADRGAVLIAPVALISALLLGVVAGINPLVAVLLGVGACFAVVVFADLAIGFGVLGMLAYLDVLPSAGGLSVDKAAGLLLAVAWLASVSSRESERTFFSEYPVLTWAMLAFLGWSTLSLIWAEETGAGITAISRYAINMMLLPIAFSAVRNRRDLTVILLAIVAGALLAGAFGIIQPPSTELAAEGRATGTIGDPNELAAALLVGLAIAAGFVLAKGRPLAVRLACFFVIPICALGVFASLSRGGLVALSAMLLAGTVLAGRWRAAITAMLALVAVSGFVYFTDFASTAARERVTTANGGSGRSDLWTVALRMVNAHPVTGVGVGNFQTSSAKYVLKPGLIKRADLIFSPAPKIAHNTYLGVTAELGLPGGLLLLVIVFGSVACTWKAARIWAERGDVGSEAIARGVLLATVGMLAADIFISQQYEKLFWLVLALGPAVLGLAVREGDTPRDDDDRGREAAEPEAPAKNRSHGTPLPAPAI